MKNKKESVYEQAKRLSDKEDRRLKHTPERREMTMKSFTRADIGCYSDSLRGYAEQGLKVQEIAVAYGMENFERVLNPLSEHFDDAVDEAIEFLNTRVEDGIVWEFRDGDFGLYEIESEAK